MSQARAIQIINRNGAFELTEKRDLRKLVDTIYADISAAAAGVVVVSADAGNDITAGSDGGAFLDPLILGP